MLARLIFKFQPYMCVLESLCNLCNVCERLYMPAFVDTLSETGSGKVPPIHESCKVRVYVYPLHMLLSLVSECFKDRWFTQLLVKHTFSG